MPLIFKEINDGAELDGLSKEIVSEILKDQAIEMAYHEVFHPSFLPLNFSVRDDSKTIAAFKNEKLLGLASFVYSKQTFLPPGFLNKIFFILTSQKAKNIQDELIEKAENTYRELKVPEISYARLNPVEKLSPSGKTLGKHGYKKRFSTQRMARTLNNIPKMETELKPVLRRVNWEEQDLQLFMTTWAKGFGWPKKYIEPSAKGITKRLLERNIKDPNTWINFLVEIDSKPIGTVAFLTFPKCAYVVNLSTLKAFRKKGIATQTMISLMEWCRKQGMKYMALDVERGEIAAINLYRKLEFKQFEESAGYIKKF